jgi:multicomponent Na+:H+ antiporter subunit G
VTEYVVIIAAAVGWAFSLSGAVGIIRMPDVYSRIQCSSKTITMGALPVLIALAVGEGPVSTYGSRALLVAVLLLVVNPAASHALARAAYKTGVPMWPGAVTDEVAQAAGRGVPQSPGQEPGPPSPGQEPGAHGGPAGPRPGGHQR